MPSAHRSIPTDFRLSRQCGMGATGFLLTALPILMLGLGGVELAHGLFVRQVLSHALVQAGRAATVDHADPDTLARAFELALHPLYRHAGSLPRALARRLRDTGQAPWRIRIVQPQRNAFTDHADADLQGAGKPPGRRIINHDYQALQHQRHLQRGWLQGRGPASGQTIFQANTLMLELIWPHEPLVPGIKSLMRALSPADDSYRGRVLANGYLPILRGISLTMQSHPVDWPDRGDGKVIHGEAGESVSSPLVTCAGMWTRCAPASADAGAHPGIPALPIDDAEGAVGGGMNPRTDTESHHPPNERPMESSGDGPSHPDAPSTGFGDSQAPDCGPGTCCGPS